MGKAKLNLFRDKDLADLMNHLPAGVIITKSISNIARGQTCTQLTLEGAQVPDADEVQAIFSTKWNEVDQEARIVSIVFEAAP